MLRTNGSAFAREIYAAPELMTLVNMINVAPVSRIPLGYYVYTVRYKFAGLVNPALPLREQVLQPAASQPTIPLPSTIEPQALPPASAGVRRPITDFQQTAQTPVH
jgi:hypothetical protein